MEKLRKGKYMNKILWLDTETTGLSPKKHGLREVAYIAIIDGQIVQKDVLFIDPFSYKKEVEISQEALDISSKTIDEFKTYPDSAFSFDKFSTLFEYVDKEVKEDCWILAGYNINFDIGFLKDWFWDNGCGKDFYKIFHYKADDVFPLVTKLNRQGLINTENDKLGTVCEYFDIKIDAHNALSDIEATKELDEILTSKYFKKVPTLREIEYAIRDSFVSLGRELGKGDWRFTTKIFSEQNSKHFYLILHENGKSKTIESFHASNEDILFNTVYEYFKG